MVRVFNDTIILCSCTAVIILLSSVYQPGSDVEGVTMTQAAMGEYLGIGGRGFVTVALVLFAFTSILYNYYLGENSLNFFSQQNTMLFNGFRVLTLALIVWGSVQDLSTVFGFADVTMGLLAIANLIALVMLFKPGLQVMRDFDRQISDGVKQPIFDSDRFPGINIDRKAWPPLHPASELDSILQ